MSNSERIELGLDKENSNESQNKVGFLLFSGNLLRSMGKSNSIKASQVTLIVFWNEFRMRKVVIDSKLRNGSRKHHINAKCILIPKMCN